MGELAGILTSVFWTFSSIIFTFAGRKVGSVILNRMRLAFALVWIVLMHWIIQGTPLPLNAAPERWFWLGLSGIIGLVLGDLFLFKAYVIVGPRITTLVMASVPVLSAVLAWIFLKENLRLMQIVGIALTVAGIALVVLEQRNGASHTDRRRYLIGLLAAFGGAVGQSLGLLLAKPGLSGNFPSISGLAIRMLVATVTIWLITLFTGQTRSTFKAVSEQKAAGLIIAGSIVGPFLGVWLSIVAIQLTMVGVASTLTSLSPILQIPSSYFIFKEKISLRAIIGTIISLVGVVVLFLL